MSLIRPNSNVAASLVLIAALLSAPRGNAAEVRTWTDVAGRKTEAKFVRVFNGEVILEKDGRALKVPLARFSTADQQHIRELTSAATSPAEATAKADAGRGTASTAEAPAKGVNAPAGAAKEPDAKAAAAELRRMREWRDTAGNIIKARFERLFGQQVVLAVGNRLRTVEFSRLSAADQEFLRRNFDAMGKAAEVPAAIARAPGAGGNAADGARDTNQLAGTPIGAAGSPASGIGQGPGFPGPNIPNFGDVASRMRQHQEQIRATQDQLRTQVRQMHDDMRAGRERTPRPAPLSNPIAEAGALPSPTSSSAFPPDAAASASPLTASTTPSAAAAPASDPFATPATVDRSVHRSPRPTFDRSRASPTPGTQPEDPLAQAPPVEPQYEAVIVCGACNKAQKPGFKAGQRCQHCGRTIDEVTDESGKVVDRSSQSTRRNVKFWVWAVIAGISVIGGLIAKLRGG